MRLGVFIIGWLTLIALVGGSLGWLLHRVFCVPKKYAYLTGIGVVVIFLVKRVVTDDWYW